MKGSNILLIIIIIAIFGILLVPRKNFENWWNGYDFYYNQDEAYRMSTYFYESENPNIFQISNNLKLNSRSQEEAVEKTLKYVFENVQYNYDEDDEVCFNSKASEILERGTGQCDTQGIVIISILRGMNIGARPVGGCLSKNPSCKMLFSMMTTFDIPQPIIIEKKPIGKEFGRSGGLHLWVEYYNTKKRSWIPLEPTNGKLADTKCWNYDVELYPSNSDLKHICVSTNTEFANWCWTR